MGSRATFRRRLGGSAARAAAHAATRLAIGPRPRRPRRRRAPRAAAGARATPWTLRVVPGPHGAPDFLTADGARASCSPRPGPSTTTPTAPASGSPGRRRSGRARTAARPACTRRTSSTAPTASARSCSPATWPVIVGPDGPSLGGFAAVAQVIRADLWRLGQVRAGDAVTLEPVDPAHAAGLQAAGRGARSPAAPSPPARDRRRATPPAADPRRAARRLRRPADLPPRRRARRCSSSSASRCSTCARACARTCCARRSGERASTGVVDLTPGVRSLHVQHDPDRLPTAQAARRARRARGASCPTRTRRPIAGRVVHLPLAWRDAARR